MSQNFCHAVLKELSFNLQFFLSCGLLFLMIVPLTFRFAVIQQWNLTLPPVVIAAILQCYTLAQALQTGLARLIGITIAGRYPASI